MKLIKVLLICLEAFSFGYCWDPDFLMNLLVPFFGLMNIQELIWFPSKYLNTKNSEKVERTINTMDKVLNVTQIVFNNRTDLKLTQTEAKKTYLAVVFTSSLNDSILYVFDRVLRGRHNGESIIVVMDEVDDFYVVQRYVKYLKLNNFFNSLLYIQNTKGVNSLWGYVEFPKYTVENRTDIKRWLKVKMKNVKSASINANGARLYTPLRQDVPYVFSYSISKKGDHLYGISYKIIELFIDFINATMVNYRMQKDNFGGDVINMKEALDLVREDRVPFLAHAYALFSSDDEIGKSYPIMVVNWCLMVPIWNSVSTYYYPVQPFSNLVWFTFLGTFLVFTVTDLALILWQYSKGSSSSKSRQMILATVSESILNDFCFILNISTGKTLRTPTTLIRAFVFLTVFFYGFFLTANYTSLLGSILTVTLFREDINTMEDLIRTNISVMIIDYELDFLLAGGNDLSEEFLKLLLPVDVATFNKHQLALNSSYAYFITDDKWHFIRLQQKHLKQGIFKLTNICFGAYHLVYPMRPDSPIWRNLEYYIFRMHSSGMIQFYERSSFDYAVHAGLMKRSNESNEFTSLHLKHLCLIFTFLVIGLAVSFLTFLVECVLGR